MSDDDVLAQALARLPRPLRTVARDVLAAEGRLDAVACAPDGAAVAVLRAPRGGDRGALVDLLAHLDWLAPRLADWKALAPTLPLVEDAPVRGLLLAPAFDPRTRAAAATLGTAGLGLWLEPPPGVPGAPWIHLLHEGEPAAPPALEKARRSGAPARETPERALRSRFRTGLRDADLEGPEGCRPTPAPLGE